MNITSAPSALLMGKEGEEEEEEEAHYTTTVARGPGTALHL